MVPVMVVKMRQAGRWRSPGLPDLYVNCDPIKGEETAITGSSRPRRYDAFHSASEVPIPTMHLFDTRAA